MEEKTETGIKARHCENLHVLVNIIVFSFILSGLLNRSFAVGCGICCLIWYIVNSRKIGGFTIDAEEDTLSFPAIFKYSLLKSVVGLFFPLFQTTSRVEIKLSDLKRISHFRPGRTDIIELCLADGVMQTLRLPSKEDADTIVSKIKEAKPDLHCDDFYAGCRLGLIRDIRIFLAVICILWSVGAISPFAWIARKVSHVTLPLSLKGQRRFDLPDSDWKFDSVTDITELKKGFLITARYKNGNRTEDVRVESDDAGLHLSGPDLQRFLIKTAIERDYRKRLQEKEKGWELEDIQVAHLRSNEYAGFATISKRGEKKEIILNIKDLGDKIAWETGLPLSLPLSR